jgi:arylsulfatase A-like enzyme
MSDHGEEFHDHGRMRHGHSTYGEVARVPLVIRWPAGVAGGARVDEVVESIDILPTLLDFSGLPHPTSIQGQSLVPLLKMKAGISATWKRRPAITEQPPMRLDTDAPDPKHERDTSWESFAINDGEWKLIHHTIWPEGRPEYELFDAKRDLLDQRNVSAEHPDAVQRLAKALDGWHQLALAAKHRPDAEAAKSMSPEQLQKLRSLGYVK